MGSGERHNEKSDKIVRHSYEAGIWEVCDEGTLWPRVFPEIHINFDVVKEAGLIPSREHIPVVVIRPFRGIQASAMDKDGNFHVHGLIIEDTG